MKHNKLKISKIIDELINFCFSVGGTEIGVNIKEKPDFFEIHLSSDYKCENKEKVGELCKLLKCEKTEEMEEYYWHLTGDSDVDTELTLVGMMTDSCNIDITPNNHIDITLFRNK